MMDILTQLANQISKGDQVKTRVAPSRVSTSKPLIKSGPGGVLFNFGGLTGNPMVDEYNRHLNHHADHEQAAIARGQDEDYRKAINQFVEKGEYGYQQAELHEGSPGVNSEWTSQLSGNTDQQVVEAFKKGMLDVNEQQQSPAGGGFGLPQIKKSTIRMGGQEIVATSETDAALIEMMKSGGAEFE